MITFACVNLLIGLVCWFILGFFLFVRRNRNLASTFAFLTFAFSLIGMGCGYYHLFSHTPHHSVAGSR